jgi:hypothetical protein
MSSQGGNAQAVPSKLEVLHDTHDTLIQHVDAKTSGGSMINQGPSIYIYTGGESSKGKGKQPDAEDPPILPKTGAGDYHSQSDLKPRSIDRESAEWGQFVRTILKTFLNSLQGRNEAHLVSTRSLSQSGHALTFPRPLRPLVLEPKSWKNRPSSLW